MRLPPRTPRRSPRRTRTPRRWCPRPSLTSRRCRPKRPARPRSPPRSPRPSSPRRATRRSSWPRPPPRPQPAPAPTPPPATPPADTQAATPDQVTATPPAAAEPDPLPAGCAVDLILGTAPIVGTDGDDTLTGTTGNDFICGLGGNDTIDGLAGDDRIDGGAGEDAVRGGDGDDRVGGGAGDDTVYGDAGDDCLGGGAGDDLLVGGPGADRLDGGSGGNALWGGDEGPPGAEDVRPPDVVVVGSFAVGCLLPPFAGDGSGGSILDDLVDEAQELAARVTGLGTEEAQASGPNPLAIRPIGRKYRQPIVDGTVRVEVICRADFTTSEGTVQLKTFPKVAEPRDLGDPARFDCTPDESRPEVTIELPAADVRLVEQLGRLRVEAVADARNPAGDAERALSHFTLLPERP